MEKDEGVPFFPPRSAFSRAPRADSAPKRSQGGASTWGLLWTLSLPLSVAPCLPLVASCLPGLPGPGYLQHLGESFRTPTMSQDLQKGDQVSWNWGSSKWQEGIGVL